MLNFKSEMCPERIKGMGEGGGDNMYKKRKYQFILRARERGNTCIY